MADSSEETTPHKVGTAAIAIRSQDAFVAEAINEKVIDDFIHEFDGSTRSVGPAMAVSAFLGIPGAFYVISEAGWTGSYRLLAFTTCLLPMFLIAVLFRARTHYRLKRIGIAGLLLDVLQDSYFRNQQALSRRSVSETERVAALREGMKSDLLRAEQLTPH